MSPTTRTPREVGTTLSRNKIMDVAERLMAQNGYAATSIAAICTESGFPVGSVYHHFGSKTGLLQQVLLRGRERLFAAFPPPAAGSPRDRIMAHYDNAGRAVAANLPFFHIEAGLLLHASLEPEVNALLAEMYIGGLERAAVLFTSIAADAGAADPERVGRRIAATTIVFSRGVACHFGMTPQRLVDAYADLAELMWNLVVDSRAGGPATARGLPGPDRPMPAATTTRSARAISAVRPSAAQDSRERFLDVAERLMADCGYTATSVADICARTGLPVGSFYHHFGSKFGLLQMLLDRGINRFSAALPEISDYRGTPRERLFAYYQGAAATILDNIDYFRILYVMQTQVGDPQICAWMTQCRGRGQQRVNGVLQQIATAAGVRDAADFGRRLSFTSINLTDGAVCGLDVEGRGLPAAFADFAELVWSAIARRAAATPRS